MNAPANVSRFRSASTSGASSSPRNLLTRNNSKKDINGQSSYPAVSNVNPLPKRFDSMPQDTSFPTSARTQTMVRSQESIDLDDAVGDSADETPEDIIVGGTPAAKTQLPHTVSAAARELIDFLADGPPDDKPGFSDADLPKKPSGRLQKMLSKLSIGDKQSRAMNGVDESSKSPMRRLGSPMTTPLASKRSYPQVPLANYPIPPRPQIITPPPSSPAQSHGSSELPYSSSLTRNPSVPRKSMPAWEQIPTPDSPVQGLSPSREPSGSPLYNTYTRSGLTNGLHKDVEESNESMPQIPKRPSSPAGSATGSSTGNRLSSATARHANGLKVLPDKPVQAPPPVLTPVEKTYQISETDAEAMRRVMSKATNADECRVIVDLFLARCGLPVPDIHSSSPSPYSGYESVRSTESGDLEHCLLELLLGGGCEDDEVQNALKSNPDVAEPLTKAHLVGNGITATPPREDTPATEWLRRFAAV
jgi:hypothetical protein